MKCWNEIFDGFLDEANWSHLYDHQIDYHDALHEFSSGAIPLKTCENIMCEYGDWQQLLYEQDLDGERPQFSKMRDGMIKYIKELEKEHNETN